MNKDFEKYLTSKGYSPNTRKNMKSAVNRFIAWCEDQHIEPVAAAYNDIVAYVGRLGHSGVKQVTIQLAIQNIGHYYNYLIREHGLTENPCSNVTIKGLQRKRLYDTFSTEGLERIYLTFAASVKEGDIAAIRDKIILGLVIYQGAKAEELSKLKTGDLKLREGKVYIAGTKRTNGREMKLTAHQLYDMMDYVGSTRKKLLAATGKHTDALFVSLGTGDKLQNLLGRFVRRLRKQNSRIKDLQHLRASVISNWLKVHNLRKTQHLAGHKYVSSTEAYQANNMEELREDVNRYHPDF